MNVFNFTQIKFNMNKLKIVIIVALNIPEAFHTRKSNHFSYLILTTLLLENCYSHFTNEETKVEGNGIIYLRFGSPSLKPENMQSM